MSHFEQFKKRTRPDMEWLLGVVSSLEKNPCILQFLMVSKNHATYRVGNPYIYLFQLNVDNFVRKIWRKKKIFQLHIVKLLRKF